MRLGPFPYTATCRVRIARKGRSKSSLPRSPIRRSLHLVLYFYFLRHRESSDGTKRKRAQSGAGTSENAVGKFQAPGKHARHRRKVKMTQFAHIRSSVLGWSPPSADTHPYLFLAPNKHTYTAPARSTPRYLFNYLSNQAGYFTIFPVSCVSYYYERPTLVKSTTKTATTTWKRHHKDRPSPPEKRHLRVIICTTKTKTRGKPCALQE